MMIVMMVFVIIMVMVIVIVMMTEMGLFGHPIVCNRVLLIAFIKWLSPVDWLLLSVVI